MSVGKTGFLTCIFFIVAIVQGQVNISGIVQSSRTKAAVAGATVKLKGAALTATTDADGKFTLSGTSVALRSGSPGKTVNFTGSGLLFRHETEGPALIRIFDLNGGLKDVVFSGNLRGGSWRVEPPQLSPGIYLCKFDTPEFHRAVRFIAPAGIGGSTAGTMRNVVDGSEANVSLTAKQAASPKPVDSLLVTKSGYRSAQVPVTSYQQTNLTIQLDDSGTVVADDATIVPDASWTCFMPDGIPPPQRGEAAFSITFQYSAVHVVGNTKFGYRRQFDITGGSVTGTKLSATVLTGGLDYELTLSTGSMEIEQINILRAGTTPILMRNAGVAPAGAKYARIVLDFEAPNSSSYTWLNTGKFAANRIVDSTAKTIKLDVYDISKATLPETRVQIKDPAGVTNQTWDCLKWSGTQGATVLTESVSLGGSISIGQSKRGSRNIIPITGGTTTGKVVGKILPGGADYQLSGLDARYTLAPNDGEFIIVRNCGSGALVPVFEARVGGPYAYLNENKYLSSQPGMSGSGVSITFYEMK
jgi:hypothetical protein